MRSTISISLALTVALVACGGDEPTGTGPTVPPPTATSVPGATSTVAPPTTEEPPAARRGWLDGEPDWFGGDAPTAEAADDSATDAPVAEMSLSDESDASGDRTLMPTEGSPLRAGSVDDNAAYDDYLAYLQRIEELGIQVRRFDPSGRIVVSVRGANGLPVAGATVLVTAPSGSETSIVTTADGTARFLPALYGEPPDGSFSFDVSGVSAEAAGGGRADLVLDQPGGADGTIALDVLFLLDATGSMGDEIDRLKTSIDSVAARVDALESAPDVRFAMTLYRDEGDAFVTATYDFTDDVAAFRAALADVVAEGGGDYPEALDEGLAEALAEPTWRDPATSVQLVFLVADAPPQVGRQVQSPYTDSIATAIGRGIKIFPVASSESDDQAEAVFRQLAQATGAPFVFLSYGAGGAATGAGSDIDRTDYEELALDDLVVRLIAEELAALTGDQTIVPPPASTTTTIPDGQ